MLSRVLFLLLCSCAADRLASLPPFDHISDKGKVAIVNSGGSGLQWSAVSAVTGYSSLAIGATNAVVHGDLVAFSGTGGKQLADSGISGNSSPSHSVLGVAGPTGQLSSISSTAANQVLVANSGATGLLWSTVGSANITDGSVSYADIQNVAALSLVGRSANSSGVAANITGADGQVCRVSGTTLGFGQMLLSSATGVTGSLSISNGGTAATTPAGAMANLTPLTTKGDLFTWNTTNARLGVGASGSVLTAYPGQSTGLGWSTSTTTIWGTQSNDNATAGYVGETLNCSRAQGGTGFTSGTPGNICSTGGNSITLTPGDWQVSGACGFLPAGTTSVTVMDCAVSKTSATLPSASVLADPSAGEIWMTYRQPATVNGNYITFAIPSFRVSVNTSTPLYLVAGAAFTVSTMSGFGYLEARRMR